MTFGEFDSSSHIGVRVVLHRFSDAKSFRGWVDEFDDIHAVIVVSSTAGLAIGQTFFLEASGWNSVATCKVELKRIVDMNLRLTVLTPIELRRPHEQARMRQAVEGTLLYAGQTLRVLVEDVSTGGLGALADGEVPVWKDVVVTVRTPRGQIQIEGQVRYCRPVDQEGWTHRIGIYAPDMARSLNLFGISSASSPDL